MTVKQVISSTQLTYEPVELLNYNTKRKKAVLYGNVFVGNTNLRIGHSGQQARSGSPIFLYYGVLEWYGINPLWASLDPTSSSPAGITILELIEE